MMCSSPGLRISWSMLFLWVCSSTHAQVIHTAHFTRVLEAAGIEYRAPAEQWLHVVYPPLHEYMDYDLVLQNDQNDFEMRFRIRLPGQQDFLIPEAVEITRLLASVATNEPYHELLIQLPTDSTLRADFNADRGIVAYFTPKADFSEKPHGALISLYAENRAVVDVILLFREMTYDVLAMFRNVRFAD